MAVALYSYWSTWQQLISAHLQSFDGTLHRFAPGVIFDQEMAYFSDNRSWLAQGCIRSKCIRSLGVGLARLLRVTFDVNQ